MKRLVLIIMLAALLASGCGRQEPGGPAPQPAPAAGWDMGKPERSMELQYAGQFSIDYYAGGYKLITLGDGSRFLVIPEGGELPVELIEGITPLYQPIGNIYLTATSAASFFDAMGRLDALRLSGTRADGWHIENMRLALERGDILYAGKYSEPDYELILSEGCGLAVQSTMISHAYEVRDKLEQTGVPVLIDQSSHESHPLGRAEWIKLYAALLNEEQQAERLFARQAEYLDKAAGGGDTGKTAAFFHINSAGQAVVRKSGDYVSRMIELAGGDYLFDDTGGPGDTGATETIGMESFIAAAAEADCLIYNGAIGGGLESLDELLELNGLFSDFRAVKKGEVWCASPVMFQDTLQSGRMISDLSAVFSGEIPPEGLAYLYRLQ